jgi:predicted short-subunit dehydrogenase-like oxidoreductase (DUF2520 family)
MSDMKIGFIGAGRVGCSLGKYLKESSGDWGLLGYYSRSRTSAQEAADFTGSRVYDSIQELWLDCDGVFVTTGDAAIAEVWQELCRCKIPMANHCVLHCSGALASTVFAGAGELGVTAASLHPFYPVSDKLHSYETLGDALFTLEGTGERLPELEEAFLASGLHLKQITAEKKSAYHAAASIGSNLMVGLAELAIEQLVDCGFDRAEARCALGPLMRANLEQILKRDTFAALTGPAERGDAATVEKHLGTLDGDDREIYRLLTRKIVEVAKQKNPGRDYGELEACLEP